MIRPTYSNQVILSRFPARLLDRPKGWPNDFRAHRLEVDAPSGRVVVYVSHLVRPHLGPRRILRIRRQMTAQRRERDALLASARAETAPVVLAGDFNTSDRSGGYRRLTDRFRDAMRGRRAGPTYVAAPVAAPPAPDRPRLRPPGLVLGRSPTGSRSTAPTTGEWRSTSAPAPSCSRSL